MMDFNLILLFVGLGLLGLVILFALWGFLGGLKRELSCIAVFLVLLVLAWLVFGNSGVLLDYNGAGVDSIRSMLNLPTVDGSTPTIWESILEYLKSMEGLNLEPLLVEGKETYNLVYSIASCVATFILLLSCTLAVVIITPIIRLISHIVLLIVNGAKKRKAKKQQGTEEQTEQSVEPEKEAQEDDAVLVLKGIEGADDAVVTVTENELPEKKKTKKRTWGAIAGALKGIFLIILVFAPISGIYAILSSASPETRQTISNLVNGNTTQQKVGESTGPTDMAFDFVDAYGKSAIGKFVEGSSYFFGQSFSTLLFDSMSSMQTTNETIKLREELVVYLETLNRLNGNLEVGTWTDEEVDAALEMLKNSKLIPAIMPVAIEYASEIEFVKEALAKAIQTAPFLTLRDIDWDKDVEIILDALKEAYRLDIFPVEDFNYLTMDEKVLSRVVATLGDTEFINKVLPIAIRTGVKLDSLEQVIGQFNQKLQIDEVNWKSELLKVVDIYAEFKKYGYTSLDQITSLSKEELAQKFVIDNFNTTVNVLDKLVEMISFGSVIIPVGQQVLDNYFKAEENGFTDFANIINLKAMTSDMWKEDFKALLESGKVAINDLNALSLDIKQMDITSDEAINGMKQIIDKLLHLNILGTDQTKNDLLIAVFNKFELFDKDDLYIYEIDASGNKVYKDHILSNINWETIDDNIGEIDIILKLVDVYKKFITLDEVDMKEFKFDFEKMLDNDVAVDILVEALEDLVDSDLVLSLINPATNKYLLPITDKYDDDNLVKDIMNSVREKALAEEIIKIVKAIKDAQKLGLFDVPKNGLQALNYQETDAMVNIIDTVFESKLFKGFEGRIIRIVFKATKLLDIEKGLLDNIDYTGERDLLVGFIREVEPILKDPEFSLTKEDGTINIDKDYLTQHSVFSHLMKGVEILFGSFEISEDGSFVETNGSKLVEALLPSIYVKYIKPAIPAEFKELLDILAIENLEGATLARDIKRLVYIASELVEMDVQTIIAGGSITYTDKLENIDHIIDVLLDIEMFKSCGNEVFAWVINYAADKFGQSLNIEKVSAADFENVNWTKEGETAKLVIEMIIDFLKENNLESTNDLVEFIKDKKYLDTSFITTINANKALDIVKNLLELQTLECLLPTVFQAAVNHLVKQEIIEKDYWNKSLTGSMLKSDLQSILTIGDILVNEMNLVEAWAKNFKDEIFVIPQADSVNTVIDRLFDLNIIKGYEADLVRFAINKFLPNNNIVKPTDFDVEGVSNWQNEKEALKELVTIGIEVIKENDFDNVSQIVNTINAIKADKKQANKYITDSNISYVASILRIIEKSDLLTSVLPAGLNYALNIAKDAGYDVTFLNDLTVASLREDILKLADIIDVAVSEKVACFIVNEELPINDKDVYNLLENVKQIVKYVSELNLVTSHEAELVAYLVNKGFELAKLTDFTLNASDFEGVNLTDDFTSIINILTVVQNFAATNELTKIRNVKSYYNDVKADYKVALTNENARLAVDAVREIINMNIVKALLPQAVNYAVDKLKESNIDISFIRDIDLTTDELANDIVTVTYIIVDLLDLNAIDIYLGNPVGSLNEDALMDIPTRLANLNILAKYSSDWMAFGLNYVLEKVVKLNGFNTTYKASDFDYLTGASYAADAESLGNALVSACKALDVLFPSGYTINQVLDFVKNKDYKNESIYKDKLIDHVFDALSSLVEMNALKKVVEDFVEYGIEKANAASYDISFIKASATNKNLAHDLQIVGEIVKEAVHFGAIKLINKENVDVINTYIIANVIDLLDQMYVYNMNRAEVWTLALNKVFSLVKVDISVTTEDFAFMTEEDWVKDNDQLQTIITSLQPLLTIQNKLASTDDIMQFVFQKYYVDLDRLCELATTYNVDAIANTLSELFKLNGLDAFFSDVVSFGVDKLANVTFLKDLDVEFIKDLVTKEALSHDMICVGEIVNSLLNFGLVEYVKTKDVANVNLETLTTAFDALGEMQLLGADRVAWMQLIGNVIGKVLKLDTTYTADDFGTITDQDAHDAIQSTKQVLIQLNELLGMLKLESISEITHFIKESGYMMQANLTVDVAKKVTEIVTTISDIRPIQPLLPKLAKYGITKLPANYDISFLVPYLENGTLSGEKLAEDIKTIMSIANDALDFGALDIYFGAYKDEEFTIQFNYVSSIINKLDKLNILSVCFNEWITFGGNKVFEALKINEKFELNDFAYMTDEMWHEDFARLATIVDSLGDLVVENHLDTYNLIKTFISEKAYTSANYVTDENVNTILDIAENALNMNLLAPVLEKGMLYAFDKFVLSKDSLKDLSFIKDAIVNDEYTGSDVRKDALVLISMLKEAVKFGAIEIYFDKKLDVIDVTPLKSVVSLVDELKIYHIDEAKLLALGMNQLLNAVKIDTAKYNVSHYDFYGIDKAQYSLDIKSLVKLLDLVEVLLNKNNIISSEDIMTIKDEKLYQTSQIINDENALIITQMLRVLSEMKSLSPVVDDLVSFAITKVSPDKVDLEFLQNKITTDTLTGGMILSDLAFVANIAENAINFGAIDYYFYKSIDNINLTYVANALAELRNLNTLKVALPEFAEMATNYGLKALKLQDRVSASDYEAMTKEDWSADLDTLITVVNMISDLLAENNFVSTDDIKEFITDKNWRYAEYANEVNAYAVLDIVDTIANLKVLEPALPAACKYGIEKASSKLDVSFLNDKIYNPLTGKALISDIHTIVSMAKDIVRFGALEYLFTKDIAHLDVTILADAINKLDVLNLYQAAKEDWLMLGLNKLLEALKTDEQVTLADFEGLNVDKEVEHLVNAILHADELLKALNLDSLSDVKAFYNEKQYMSAQVICNENIDICVNLVDEIAQMQSAKVVLPPLAAWGVSKINNADLEFLVSALRNKEFTSDELINDVKTILDMTRKGIKMNLFDAIFDYVIDEINGDIAAEIVSQIDSITLYTKLRTNWIALGFNKALASLNITVTPEEFEAITTAEWLEDNAHLQEAVKALCAILNDRGLTYKSVITNFIKNKDYLNIDMTDDTTINHINNALTNVLSTHSVNVVFGKLLQFAIDKASEKGFDISFIETYTASDLANDVMPILAIAKNLIHFGIKEFITDNEISHIDVTYLANAVNELENVRLFTMFRPNWVALGLNKVFSKIKLDVTVDEATLAFDDATWKADNQLLQQLILKLGEILENNNLTIYSDAVNFIKDHKYALEETYTDENLRLIADAMKIVLSFHAVDAVFPSVLDAVIEKADKAQLDISFLKSTLNTTILKNDVDVIVNMFRPICKFGLFSIIKTKEVKFLNVEYLKPVVQLIPSLGMYQLSPADWAASLINFIAVKAKLDMRKVEASDFASVDWNKENTLFLELMDNVDQFLVETDLVSVKNLNAWIKSGFKVQEKFATAEYATYLINTLDALTSLQTVELISIDVVNAGLEMLNEKSQLDYRFLTGNVSNEQVVSDIHELLNATRKLVEFGIIEVVLKDANIDYAQKALVYSALNSILNLNMFVGNENQVIDALFTKLDIDSSLATGTVIFASEYSKLVTIIDNVIVILESYNLNTIKQIKSFNFKTIKLNNETDDVIMALANIINVLQDDALFNYVVMPLSNKYLAKDNLSGVADLHNIYPTVDDLRADLAKLYNALLSVYDLHIYDFISGVIDYPYTNRNAVVGIINNIFTLNYFNLPNRMEAFINGLATLINTDLSSINPSNLDLATDADKLIAMYDELVKVLADEKFPIKNRTDLSGKINVKFFLTKENLTHEVNAIKEYMETTIYEETGPAILLVLIPLFKTVLKDYWDALDLDNYKFDKINHDSPYLKDIFETIMDLDPVELLSGNVQTDDIDNAADVIIDSLQNLKLFEGHMNAFVELLLRDFVYGKNNVESGSFDIANVDFNVDLNVVKDIIHEIARLMNNVGLENTNEIKDYIKNVSYKEIVDDDTTMIIIARISDLLTESTFVKHNLKQVYDIFAVPQLEKKDMLKYLNYKNATNEEMNEDLTKVSTIIKDLVDIRFGKILNGDPIDYVNSKNPSMSVADIIKSLVNTISSTNYINLHIDTYLELLGEKVRGIKEYNVTSEDIDVIGDLNILADVYAILADYFNSSDFVVKTIDDFKTIKVKDLADGAYKHINDIMNAYDLLIQTSIAPYFFQTIIDIAVKATPDKYKDLVDVLNSYILSIDEIKSDLEVSAQLLRDLVNTNIIEYVLFKDALLPANDAFSKVIDDLFAMNCITKNLDDLVEEAIKAFEINTTDINLEAIDLVADKDLVKEALIDIMNGLIEMNYTTYKEAVDFVKLFVKSGKVRAQIPSNAVRSFVMAMQKLIDTTVGYEILLPVARKVLGKVELPANFEALKPVLALEKYDNQLFNEDLHILSAILMDLLDSKLYKYWTYKDETIEWDNPYIEGIIRNTTELHAINLYGQELVDLVEKLTKVDLSAFNTNNVDYQAEQDAYVNVYAKLVELLMRTDSPLKTMNDIESAIKTPKSFNWKYYIEYATASLLVEALKELEDTTLSVELYAVILANLKKSKLVVAKYFDSTDLTTEQKHEDFRTMTLLAQAVIDFVYNNGKFVRVGKDSSLENVQAAQDVVTYVMMLNVFEGKYADMLNETFNKLHVETSDMNLEDVNFLAETEIVKQLLVEGLNMLKELDITSYQKLNSLLKDYSNLLKTNKKEFLRKVDKDLRVIDLEHLVNMIELFDQSTIVDEVTLPVYNRFVTKYQNKFGKYGQYMSLAGYAKTDFINDTHLLAQAARSLYNSGVHTAYFNKATLTDEQLDKAAEAIRIFGQMSILEFKKLDFVKMINASIKQDISALDFSGVSMSHDFNVIANMVPAIYTFYKESKNFRLSMSSFGNTTLMNALIDIYELYLATDISDVVTPWLITTSLKPLDKQMGTSKFNLTDAQALSLANDVLYALRALSEMGAFSNDGIDFTNSALTNKVFDVFYNFNLNKKERAVINQFRRNAYELGILDVNYSKLNTKAEFKAFKVFVKDLATFIKNYSSSFKNKDYAIISNVTFQNDVTFLVEHALDSELINQLFMPLVVFTSKVCTEKYGKIAICDGMTSDDFVNIALPDIYKMASYAEQIGAFTGKVDYKQKDAIISLAELITTSALTKDLCDDIMPMLLKAMLKVNVTKADLVALDVDYAHEVACFKEFLNDIYDQIEKLTSGNADELLDKDVLIAFANAGRHLETSKIVKLLMKRALKGTITKISSTTDVLDFMLNSLNDPNYTDDDAMEDYMMILNIVEQAAYINFFKGSIDYKALYGHIDILLDNLFRMNATKNNEEKVMRSILNKLTFVDTTDIDLTNITDWDSEFTAFTSMINALAELCADDAFDIENITSETFENKAVQDKFVMYVDYASQSYVGSELLIKLFATKVEPNLPSDAQGIIDLETLPKDKWAGEFEELFRIYVVVNKGLDNVSASDIINVYDIMFGLNGNDGLEAVKADYHKWLVKMLDKANFQSTSEGFGINKDAVPTDNENALNEVIAIRNVLNNFIGYLDSENQKISELSYKSIIQGNDYEKFAETLILISNSLSMRELLLGMIGDSLIEATDNSGNSTFKVKELGSTEFWNQYNKVTPYDTDFWTEEELTTFAIFVVCANTLEISKEGKLDVLSIDLGTAYPNVNTYNNVVSGNSSSAVSFPSQINGSNNVGLRQLLQLMNASSIFDITPLARYTDASGNEHNGLIADALIQANIINTNKANYRALGVPGSSYGEWNNEIIALTAALQALKNEGLLVKNNAYSQSIATRISTMTSSEIVDLLSAVNESEILRPLIPEVLYDGLYKVLVGKGATDEMAKEAIRTMLPSLALLNENPDESLGTKEEISDLIQDAAVAIEMSR